MSSLALRLPDGARTMRQVRSGGTRTGALAHLWSVPNTVAHLSREGSGMSALRKLVAAVVTVAFASSALHAQAASERRWTLQGMTYLGSGGLKLDARGDSLDFNGIVTRAGLATHLGLRTVRGEWFLRPSVGMTLSSLKGIAAQGRGVGASSVDVGATIGYRGRDWSMGLIGERGGRLLEYRATGPIENPAGSHSALGLRVGVASRRIPLLRTSPGEVVFSYRKFETTFTKSDSGDSHRAIADIDATGWGWAVSWESDFRGGWKKNPGEPQGSGLPTAFSFLLENDAFVDSDTGYTNAVRASWTGWHGRVGTVIRTLTFARLGSKERYCGIDESVADSTSERACWLVSTGVGQSMYTPSDLRAASYQTDDRPFAGFLFLSGRAQRINQTRYAKVEGRAPLFPMIALSNEAVVGMKGPRAGAAETQALAHWTWSNGAVRPTGWVNQLRNELVGGYTLEAAARVNWMEACGRTSKECTGYQDENRWLDFTPRSELVVATHMLRASVGGVLRIGYRFPSVVTLDRLSSTANIMDDDEDESTSSHGPSVRSESSPERRVEFEPRKPWGLLFFTGDFRTVGRNAFLEGGFRDQGGGEWGSVRGIARSRFVGEIGGGAQAGVGRWAIAIHVVHRQPEYRVLAQPEPRGVARYASFTVTRANF